MATFAIFIAINDIQPNEIVQIISVWLYGIIFVSWSKISKI